MKNFRLYLDKLRSIAGYLGDYSDEKSFCCNSCIFSDSYGYDWFSLATIFLGLYICWANRDPRGLRFIPT